MIGSLPACSSCRHESAIGGRGICSSAGAPSFAPALRAGGACAPKTSRSGNGLCSPGRPPQFGEALGVLLLADLPRKRPGCHPERVRDMSRSSHFGDLRRPQSADESRDLLLVLRVSNLRILNVGTAFAFARAASLCQSAVSNFVIPSESASGQPRDLVLPLRVPHPSRSVRRVGTALVAHGARRTLPGPWGICLSYCHRRPHEKSR